jgi:hypothetical protein
LEEPEQFSSLAPFTPNAFTYIEEPTDIERKPIISLITRTSRNERKKLDTRSLVDEGKEVKKTKV